MVRIFFKLWLLLGLGVSLFAWLSSQTSPLPMLAPARSAASLDTPLGDAGFRIQCTYALRERLAGHPEWPLQRVASLCRCIAERLREGEPRRLPDPGRADPTARLSLIESRLCR